MPKYDVIIIGAGFSGLTAGALLAKAGEKVLILEKGDMLGGRASCVLKNGQPVDNAIKIPTPLGHFETVFKRIGKELPKYHPYTSLKMFHEGKWQNITDLFPHDIMRKIYNEILSMSFEDIEKLDEVSLKDWLDARTDNPGIHLYWWWMGWSMAVGGWRYDQTAAGDVFYWMKELYNFTGSLKAHAGVFPGGMRSLSQPLADAIKEQGGKIELNKTVSNVVVKKGIVCGVEVETGERIVPLQVLDTEMIEAPTVISTVPLWDLWSIITPEVFPPWYVEWINHATSRHTYTFGIRYSLDKPLWPDEQEVRAWMVSPRGAKDIPAGIGPEIGYGADTKEYVVEFWQQAMYNDLPVHFRQNNKPCQYEARKLLREFDKDVKVLFPDLESHVKSKIWTFGTITLAEVPGNTGWHRPDIQPPAVKGLYLASESTRPGRPYGVDTAFRCGQIVADVILKKS